MVTKHELKLEIFVPVCWSYCKWFMSLVKSTVIMVDHSVVKGLDFSLPYKWTTGFVEIYSGLEGWLVSYN